MSYILRLQVFSAMISHSASIARDSGSSREVTAAHPGGDVFLYLSEMEPKQDKTKATIKQSIHYLSYT